MNDKADLMADGLVTVAQACSFLGLGKSKVYELMQSEDLPYVQIGGVRRIPRRALANWVAKRLVGRDIAKAR